VTGRALRFFRNISNECATTPAFLHSGKPKNARVPLGPEYIAKVALKAIAKAGIDTAEWKAHSFRGAAATHFMAKGVPGAVVQARGGWASAATMATHYARQHQLIPWAELASSPPDLASGSGDIASSFSSSSLLPRASLQSFSSTSVGAGGIGIFAVWCKLCGKRGEAEGPLPESTPEDERGGPRHSALGTHNCWTPIFRSNGKYSRCVPCAQKQQSTNQFFSAQFV